MKKGDEGTYYAVLEWTDGMEIVINATRKIAKATLVINEQLHDIAKALEDETA